MNSSHEPTPSSTFVRKVQQHRDRLGMTQEDLVARLEAAGIPMTQPVLARLEGGQRGVKLDEAVAIARALQVPLVNLVTDDDDMDARTRDATAGVATATLERLQQAIQAVMDAERHKIARDWLMGDDHGQGA